MKQVPQLAKKSRVWDGTAWQELASAQTDLTPYSTTAQMNTAIDAGVGLVPILTQTIGTAVSSVVVTNAFSATYENYKIVISGGVASTGANLGLKLGATATGYYAGHLETAYNSGTVAGSANNNTTSWSFTGYGSTLGLSFNVDLINPFLTNPTLMTSLNRFGGGLLNNSTSYTDFTITPASGTITGGTIQVYGYKK